jgi:multiple sugar transport system ATP-binding protein
MATVQLSNLSKTFADGTAVVRGVDMTIPDGEFCVLLGPSGCGKSTTLRMIAGLEVSSGGRIVIGGRDVTDAEPKDRDVAMVFQNYALYPHLTVAENIAFPLAMRGVDKATRARKVREIATMLELDELLGRVPAQLSGGQRQRVAMGRALVRDPKVFLFDEPLSNLDARLRAQTRRELKALHARVRITSVYVTHDQEEAMSLADKVAVMAGGVIQQYDSPLELFRRPTNRFVAGFVGTPAMNFVEARVEAKGEGQGQAAGAQMVVTTDLGRMRLGAGSGDGLKVGDVCTLGIRPTAIDVRRAGAGSEEEGEHAGVAQGVIESCDLLGEVSDLWIRCGSQAVLARVRTQDWMRSGEACLLGMPRAEMYVFEPGSMGKRLSGGESSMGEPRGAVAAALA